MQRYLQYFWLGLIISIGCLPACAPSDSEPLNSDKKLRALIVDGQSNHGGWPRATMMLKDYLEQTGLFDVDIERTAFTWQGPANDKSYGIEARKKLLEEYPLPGGKQTTIVDKARQDPDFKPDFSKYDVVLSHFGWRAAPWPEETKSALENYISKGGGLITVHSANNSFGDWDAYNEMIGLGGWGDRNTESGPYVYYDQEGKLVRDTSEGVCGSHGPQYAYLITMRDSTHPITKGLPAEWMHTKDEMYDRLRGPAKNMRILATTYSDVTNNTAPWAAEQKGTGRNEPMLITVEYGKGRVFHTVMGHTYYSMECVGFITTLQRGAEWAATGKVTQEIPDDFPGKAEVSKREWKK